MPAIVHALRDATRVAHARLDAASPISTPHLTLAAYHELLGRYLAAHRAVETALEPWSAALGSIGVTIDERRKVPALLADRAFTGSQLARTVDHASLAIEFSLPSLASALGALYVMEGSTLGGQHLLRELLKSEMVVRSGLRADAGLAYFTGYGSRTGDMWRQLLRVLGDADARNPGERDAIIHGAQHAFALFERALSGDNTSP